MLPMLLLVVAARLDQLAFSQPILLPREERVPSNVRFLVLWPEDPARVWLVDDRGERLPSTFERQSLGGGHEAVVLHPGAPLPPGATSCLRVGQRVGYWERCYEVEDRVDLKAPLGGALRAARAGGGKARLDFEPGTEESPIFLELSLSGPGGSCRDFLWAPRALLGEGLSISVADHDGGEPGTGARCFAGLADGLRTLQVRWWDVAGNAGPWSGAWTLAAGARDFTAP